MNVTTISAVEFAEMLRAGRAVEIIDVRTAMEYRELHVASARNVPLNLLEPSEVVKTRAGAENDALYIVCRSGARGQQACEKFLAAGFTNVINVEGGTLACLDCGVQVVRGKKIISLDRQVRIVAGSLIVLFAALGWLAHPAFLALCALVGAGLVCAGVTDKCGLGLTLA